MTTDNAWFQADIRFRRTPDRSGQDLGSGTPQVQASTEVQFDSGWLHIRQPNSGDIITIPAEAVDYIVRKG